MKIISDEVPGGFSACSQNKTFVNFLTINTIRPFNDICQLKNFINLIYETLKKFHERIHHIPRIKLRYSQIDNILINTFSFRNTTLFGIIHRKRNRISHLDCSGSFSLVSTVYFRLRRSLLYDGISQNTDLFHFTFHHIALFHESGWIKAHAHTRWSACGNDVARFQGDTS